MYCSNSHLIHYLLEFETQHSPHWFREIFDQLLAHDAIQSRRSFWPANTTTSFSGLPWDPWLKKIHSSYFRVQNVIVYKKTNEPITLFSTEQLSWVIYDFIFSIEPRGLHSVPGIPINVSAQRIYCKLFRYRHDRNGLTVASVEISSCYLRMK